MPDLPDVPLELVRRELTAYLADACDEAAQMRPTRCVPWTVRDLTVHLAETFGRFKRMLTQTRAGDLTPPFPPERLAEENLRRVATFAADRDPAALLDAEAAAFLAKVHDQDEPIAHQFGPLPMRVQLGFALNELALHHDDLAHACRRHYEPDEPVPTLLVTVWEHLGRLPIIEPGDTPWTRVVRASGR